MTRDEAADFVARSPHASDRAALVMEAVERYTSPISRMSVEEIEQQFVACDTVFHREQRYILVTDAAHVAHRLAQPVARVDEDAGAKRIGGIWKRAQLQCAATDEECWQRMPDWERNCARAVAAAKEAGDA